MSPPSDVCIVLPDLKGGGVERMRLHLAEDFIARGLQVELLLLERAGDLLDCVPAGLPIVALNAPRLRASLLPMIHHFRRTRPRAVLAAMWPLTLLSIAAARAVPGTRVVASEHSTLSRTPLGRTPLGRIQLQTSIRLLYPKAHGIITPSLGVKEDLEALCGWSESPIEVVPNPVVRLNQPAPLPLPPSDAWAQPGEPRLIAIGSLKEPKDYPTLLRAFAILVRRRPARLLILGQGSLLPALEREAQNLGIADHVRFGGFVEDPRPYLLASDLFVLSSSWEGFGNVIVEALAQGVPVVSTDCPSGPSEILDAGRYGTLVPIQDPEALAAAMHTALEREYDREALIARARTYSVDRAADRYLQKLSSTEPSGHFVRAAR